MVSAQIFVNSEISNNLMLIVGINSCDEHFFIMYPFLRQTQDFGATSHVTIFSFNVFDID